MNKVAKFAVAAAVAMVLGAAVPALAADAPATSSGPKPQVSAAAGKDLQAAQKALNEQKYDEVLVDLDKVKNNPKKNEYDDYVMNEFLVSAYAGQKKLDEAVVPLEAIMASKYMPPDELKRRVQQATYLYYQLKNYDKAIEYGNRAIQAGDAPAQLQTAVAQAYYLKNDFKGTDKFVQGMVDDEVKAGQVPSEELLQLGLSSSLKQNDDAGEARWLEVLVQYHPKPEYWENVIQTLYHNKLNDKQLLQVYRLSADVGILKGSDYAEMAQLALDAGSPGEAVSILTKGFANNVFTEAADKNRNQHLLDSAKKQAAADQPTLPKSEAEAATAAGGDRYVGAGIGYFGYGDYDKAAKDIAAGLAKGTTKDSTDARLILGISQLKSGDKDGAVKTFHDVKGDPVEERVAALWILHAKSG